MQTRRFALIAGIIFLVFGIAGFISGITQPPPVGAPDLALEGAHGYLFGLFPVNWLDNLVYLAIGAWGLWGYGTVGKAKSFARGATILFAVFAVMGFIPGLKTIFGLMPLHGNDIWLHALTAVVSGYFGYVRKETAVSAPPMSRAA